MLPFDIIHLIALHLPIESLYKFMLLHGLSHHFWSMRLRQDYTMTATGEEIPFQLYSKLYLYRQGHAKMWRVYSFIDSKKPPQIQDLDSECNWEVLLTSKASRGDIVKYRRVKPDDTKYYIYVKPGELVKLESYLFEDKVLPPSFDIIEKYSLDYWLLIPPAITFRYIYFNPLPYLDQIKKNEKYDSECRETTPIPRKGDQEQYINVSHFYSWYNERINITYYGVPFHRTNKWYVLYTGSGDTMLKLES